jgi:hypothetical protein
MNAMPLDDFALDASPFLAMSPPTHSPYSCGEFPLRFIKLFDNGKSKKVDCIKILDRHCSTMAKIPQKTPPGGANTPTAKRLRQLRAAERYETASAFARKMDISVSRYLNFEIGSPLSIEVALKIVRTVPGCTLDWLYIGERRGLSFDLRERLSMVEELEARANARGGSGRST